MDKLQCIKQQIIIWWLQANNMCLKAYTQLQLPDDSRSSHISGAGKLVPTFLLVVSLSASTLEWTSTSAINSR